MKQSPGFSSFRKWLDIWDYYLENEEKENKIRNLLNGQNLIFFFKKGNSVFGAPEESRVVFAKMKSPEEDAVEDWIKEASFAAFDLVKALDGNEVENIFTAKDLNSIKIIDKEEAEDLLKKRPAKEETPDLKKPHDEEGANVITLKDKN